MKEQINEQLALLEKELSRLKKVTDYIDDTKSTAQSVIYELKTLQVNYSSHLSKIYDLYTSTVEQIKKETELQIKEGVIHFETTGSKIDKTNREKLLETKKLLENYRKTVESTDNLVKTIEAVNFPRRLDEIEQQAIENQGEIKNRFRMLDKQNIFLKILLFTILGLICVFKITELLL